MELDWDIVPVPRANDKTSKTPDTDPDGLARWVDEGGATVERRRAARDEGLHPIQEHVGDVPPAPSDPINPVHYRSASGLEVIDVIEAFGLHNDHYRASALAYILRAGQKPNTPVGEDIQKAIWYLERSLRDD